MSGRPFTWIVGHLYSCLEWARARGGATASTASTQASQPSQATPDPESQVIFTFFPLLDWYC